MDVYINQDQKQVLCILPRCGTNRVRDILANHPVWKDYYEKPSFGDLSDKFKDYTTIKIVRDPYKRFLSWFCAFAWDDNLHPFWTVKDAKVWLEDFDVQRHYDPHTGLQSVLYNVDPKFSHNNMFIRMEDIDLFFNQSNVPHVANMEHRVRINELHISVRKYFKHSIDIMYARDFEWLKKIEIWKKSS